VEVTDSLVEGVLYARGSHNLGHSLFIKDSHLNFVYNALGKIQRASAKIALTPGRHSIGARFDRTANTGELSIFVDGTDVASVHIPVIMRILGSMGMDLGCDRLSPVAPDYDGPFPFTGTINRVHFEVRSKMSKVDVAMNAKVEASRE
jgi:arylsulfatase